VVPGTAVQVDQIRVAVRSLGFDTAPLAVRRPEDFADAIVAIEREHANGYVALRNP
jgi:hypothetical protein